MIEVCFDGRDVAVIAAGGAELACPAEREHPLAVIAINVQVAGIESEDGHVYAPIPVEIAGDHGSDEIGVVAVVARQSVVDRGGKGTIALVEGYAEVAVILRINRDEIFQTVAVQVSILQLGERAQTGGAGRGLSGEADR